MTSPKQPRPKSKGLSSVNDVLIPQDLDYPGLELNINREQAAFSELLPRMLSTT